MPEHPSDDYLLVNSGIKISRVNCELGAEGFWKRSSGNTIGRGGLGGARRRRGENEREREDERKNKGIRERRRRRRRSVWPRLSLLFTLGSIAAWLWRLLQYRRGGNRPITCRLLICSTQTAAVLPPMRKTCVDPLLSLLECISTPPSIEHFDPPRTHAAIFDRSPGSPLLSFPCALIPSFFSFANYFDPSPLLSPFYFFFLLQLPAASNR